MKIDPMYAQQELEARYGCGGCRKPRAGSSRASFFSESGRVTASTVDDSVSVAVAPFFCKKCFSFWAVVLIVIVAVLLARK